MEFRPLLRGQILGCGFYIRFIFLIPGDDMDQCGLLSSFLDQSYLWVGESGLQLGSFGWLSLEALFLLCSFTSGFVVWVRVKISIFINDSSVVKGTRNLPKVSE